MKKVLIRKNSNEIDQFNSKVLDAIGEGNNLIETLRPFAPVKSQDEAIRLFNDPAGFIVEKMELAKNSPLAAGMDPEKLLSLLDDQRPYEAVKAFRDIEKAFRWVPGLVKDATVIFKGGKFVENPDVIAEKHEQYSIYAKTPSEIKAYNLQQEIVSKLQELLQHCNTGPLLSGYGPVSLPFAVKQDRNIVFYPDGFLRLMKRNG